eukprot:1160353-Pelagomonas_calceolata.AAC.10
MVPYICTYAPVNSSRAQDPKYAILKPAYTRRPKVLLPGPPWLIAFINPIQSHTNTPTKHTCAPAAVALGAPPVQAHAPTCPAHAQGSCLAHSSHGCRHRAQQQRKTGMLFPGEEQHHTQR